MTGSAVFIFGVLAAEIGVVLAAIWIGFHAGLRTYHKSVMAKVDSGEIQLGPNAYPKSTKPGQ